MAEENRWKPPGDEEEDEEEVDEAVSKNIVRIIDTDLMLYRIGIQVR